MSKKPLRVIKRFIIHFWSPTSLFILACVIIYFSQGISNFARCWFNSLGIDSSVDWITYYGTLIIAIVGLLAALITFTYNYSLYKYKQSEYIRDEINRLFINHEFFTIKSIEYSFLDALKRIRTLEDFNKLPSRTRKNVNLIITSLLKQNKEVKQLIRLVKEGKKVHLDFNTEDLIYSFLSNKVEYHIYDNRKSKRKKPGTKRQVNHFDRHKIIYFQSDSWIEEIISSTKLQQILKIKEKSKNIVSSIKENEKMILKFKRKNVLT